MGQSGKVRIALESVQDGSSHVHTYAGEWFRKELSVFVRYVEPAQEEEPGAGEVRTLVRYRPGELSIVRRGAVESEQLFAPGMRRTGYYRSRAASFPLETDTKLLRLAAGQGEGADGLPGALPFTLEWQYELLVGEQMSGRFHIRLHIREEQD
ncbi:DUF1934 domain-containing protein [Paenibacillus arenilitoris]|uniref:DUF1934 domain-containing protein n=1 Tax=Paenibacillus arenilitoris TaxID=2772299 RepID=A0A927CTI9_9BACL|nr:DUF1934 domain-containing protein [Paenibacillus arenilitoris]MBD2871601.1 DUF1934 domain-containing protein [Paenibacillus arenilitoris]